MNPCNINIGVLGHVDSGKTSLVRVLSEVFSTASLDKHPQSRERGITLDLGFSECSSTDSSIIKGTDFDMLELTFVDCPGHSTLIKTIIGGAQIIDAVLLVVDIRKGIQTQTGECIVLSEIMVQNMVIALNKIDTIPEERREQAVSKAVSNLRTALSKTKFATSPIVRASIDAAPLTEKCQSLGVDALHRYLTNDLPLPRRTASPRFCFLYDHCFLIKGRGTVFTGTILEGAVKENDTVQILSSKSDCKVKSIQRFRRGIARATQGDRVALCLGNIDPPSLERSILCTPNSFFPMSIIVLELHKVPYFSGDLFSGMKIHITVGHETTLGVLTFIRAPAEQKEYYCPLVLPADSTHTWKKKMVLESIHQGPIFILTELEKPLLLHAGLTVIGAKLDTDTTASTCRIAFHGPVVAVLLSSLIHRQEVPDLSKLRVFKQKRREGKVERLYDDRTIIVKDLFSKDADFNIFNGMKAQGDSFQGIVDCPFGKSGKMKVTVTEGTAAPGQALCIVFKRFLHDPSRAISQ